MISINDLLNRIQWDEEFGRSSFEIGYLDRLAKRIVRVPFRQLILTKGDHFAFQLMDTEGVVRSIPFHRIREVYRDGELIWKRGE